MSSASARLLRIVKETQKKSPSQSRSKPPRYAESHFSFRKFMNEPNNDELSRKFKLQATQFVDFRRLNNLYDFTISRLALAKRFSLIEDILETHKGFEDMTREKFAVRLVVLYGKSGMFEHARKVFDEMPERNCRRTVWSLNALMKAALECGKFGEVCRIFEEIPLEMSVKPDAVSYNTVIHALCKMGLLDDAVSMLEKMKDEGLMPDAVTFCTLQEVFYRERGFAGGERIWAMMVDNNVAPNIRSYTLKLQALVDAGHFRRAVVLFRKLDKDRFKLHVDAYNVFIKGFSDQGNVVAAKRWYSKLLRSGATPNKATFSVLVPQFCEGGDYNMAFGLCKFMFNRQMVVDEALLQRVVDGLVKVSRVEEAKELVKLGKSNNYVQYNLTMPSDV